MFGNEALELPSEGEPTRHLSRMEPVGFSDRHRRKDIIGQIVDHPAHAERRPRDRVPVVEIRTGTVYRTDIKAEIQIQLLLREPCRKLIAEIPAVRPHQRNFAVEAVQAIVGTIPWN